MSNQSRMDNMQMQLIQENEQYRMCRLQVYNWGTFTGLHDISISDKGFLFVGGSGAGKTTILDAFSVLLIPPKWIELNAAASETERRKYDRSLVSYIRGAWADQEEEDTGLIAKQYLRPGPTWSALALTYKSKSGHTVVLVQLLWLKGNLSANSDVRRHFFIFEREFDLYEMESFGLNNMDIRKLKQHFEDVFAQDDFSTYRERFCRLLGIDREEALKLLHKTQSAKSIGDLDSFLRNFMLDTPETFTVADRLVNEFGELDEAHRAVITAREQIGILAPAREKHAQMEQLTEKRTELNQLRDGIGNYCEFKRMELLKKEIDSLEIDIEGLNGQINNQKALLDNAKSVKEELEREHREIGGDEIARLESKKKEQEKLREEHLRKQGQARDACVELGWTLSESPQDFALLIGKAREEIESLESNKNTSRNRQFDLSDEKRNAERILAETLSEVNSLENRKSNIPADMLRIRKNVADALGTSEEVFPFAGELIGVKPEENMWQGAIERVLHGFALSVLVDDNFYNAFSEYINNTHLSQRFIYYRIGGVDTAGLKSISEGSMITKLNIKEGRYKNWLQAQLRSRFDYTCADSVQELHTSERAITREGLVKHNRTRHEKDDRHKVDDRRNYVLGFDNREKLSLFKQQAKELTETISLKDKEINRLTEQENINDKRARHCQTIVNLQWQEIDVIPIMDNIAGIDRLLKEKRDGNENLQNLEERIKKQSELAEKIDGKLSDIKGKYSRKHDERESARRKLHSLESDKSITPLTPLQESGLAERYERQNRKIQLDNLDNITRGVESSLNNDINATERGIADCEKIIEQQFAEYKRNWAIDAGELDCTLASAPEFFEKLHRLETDGLPGFEDRFFGLLKDQSYQNLTSLNTYMNNERKVIRDRMMIVNDSLKQVPFNKTEGRSTYLSIEDLDRQLPVVIEFKQDIRRVLSHAWNEEDRETAEIRFNQLRELVKRFSSRDSADEQWKKTVLDVRKHVEFIGREKDETGVEVEVYRSGSGKSGGQRQKLTTTCLAAALRYQLGGETYGIPMYAPVILDEAFDKADNEFTTLAMNIFSNFGFQMIVATPLKSVMTLEPFIGGACFVDIKDRKTSSILLIEYDSDKKRLNLPLNSNKEKTERHNNEAPQ